MLVTSSPGVVLMVVILWGMMLLVGLLVIFVIHTNILKSLVTTTVHAQVVGLHMILAVHSGVVVVGEV